MDWMLFARNDWDIYGDPARIEKFVEFGKITPEQYAEIVGDEHGDS